MKSTSIVAEKASAPWGATDEGGGGHGWVASLLVDPDRAPAVPLDHVPTVLGQIERLKAILWSRLSQADAAARRPATNDIRDEGRVLTPAEAAQIAGVTVRWLYRHAGQLPFARRLSRKTLRFSEAGLRRWLACRRP